MWLPLIWLIVAGLAALIAYLLFDYILVILGVVVALVIGFWILGCIFSPAMPDRKCPRCGKEGLVKLQKGEPTGVRCEHCGFRDESKYVAYLDEW